MRRRVLLLTAAAVVVAACASSPPESAREPAARTVAEEPTLLGGAPPGERSVQAAAAGSGYVSLLAVGDIASCDVADDAKVATLAKDRTGRVAILGDVVYPNGSADEFANCFDPDWGPLGARMRPAVGNHEYATPGATGYWNYFGDRAGRRDKGWYAYNLGEHWRAIVLNTNCARVGGCTLDSPQGRWLRNAIDNAGNRNIVAYFHHPLYSSGHHGSNPFVRPFYRALYRGGADLVLAGHDHNYERFAPQNHRGERRRRGVQQFVVGTGGFKHYAFGSGPLTNTRARNNTSFGLLKLRLRAGGYSWEFIPATGGYTDSGSRSLG